MNNETKIKLEGLNYNGSAQEQFDALLSVLKNGIKNTELAESVIDCMDLDLCESIIQMEYC